MSKNRATMSAEELRANEQLAEKLKFFMAERDLTIEDVARLIGRNPGTVWAFLWNKVKSQDRTLYRIKKLVRGEAEEKASREGKRHPYLKDRKKEPSAMERIAGDIEEELEEEKNRRNK